jgi:ABC-2 type transport system permease protein
VLGPFLLLLLFGAGYQDANIQLRTEFVGPPGSVYEQAVTDYADQLEQYIEPMGFTTDVDAAVERLNDGDLDAVVVFPTDALEAILSGESAKITILHEKLDPFQQAAIDIASRLAVQEVNASVLGAIASGAQAALRPVDQAATLLTEQAATLSAAVAAGDTAAAAAAAATVSETLRGTQLVMTTSQDVIKRLGGGQVNVATDIVARLDAAADDADAISAGGGNDISAQASALAATLQEVAGAIPEVDTVDPAVLVRPFEADAANIAPVEIEPVDFFAPSSIALLLQHLALTFAALSLVRDRELGLLELLRVGPLSSMEILVGKTIAYLMVGLTVGASLLAAAVFVLGVPMQGEALWVASVVTLVLLASLALGMVLSMISGSETQAVQFAMLTLLAGMFFSGFFLDVSQLAAPYRYVSYLLPVTYGINALQDVMLRGVDPARSDLTGLGILVFAYGSMAVLLLHRRLRVE